MTFPRLHATCAILALFPGAAVAQIAPADFLTEFQALYAAQGLTLSYESRAERDGALVLEGLAWAFDNPQASADMTLDSMTIRPTDAPGFDLEVEMTPEVAGQLRLVKGGGRTRDFEMQSSERWSFLVGGSPDNRVVEVSYPEIIITGSLSAARPELSPTTMTVRMADVSETVEYSLEHGTVAFDMTLGSLEITADIAEHAGSAVDLSVTFSDVTLASQGVLGELADVAAVYGNDTLTGLTLRAARAAMALSADKGGQVTDVNVTLGPSQMHFAAGQKLADFTLGADAMTVDVTYGPMPAAQVAMQRLETRLAVPMLPSEALKPIALRLMFDEVTANDALWSMIDPRGALSRQPATLRLDLDGTARALVNLLEPEEGPLPEEPWEYGDLALNELLLRLAGAEISGSAAGRIDNSGATPMPIGVAEFEMVGVSGLINTLGQIGLLTPQQAFPAQLMLGMFGKPTGAPDTFETRIEATEDGRILANGEPL